MATPPDRGDADVLLHLLDLFLSEPVAAARMFVRTIPDGRTIGELREQHPPGSIGDRQIQTVMVFWETVGSLIKHGLLSEDLAFDTFLDAPPWPKMEAAIRSMREERNNPLEGENIEYAYRRSVEWVAARNGRHESSS